MLLSKMYYEGEVDRVTTGVYRLPNPQTELDIDKVGDVM